MKATALRAVHTLSTLDILQVSSDPRFFRVTGVERSAAGARYKVMLLSLDGEASVMLVRDGREMVLAVPR